MFGLDEVEPFPVPKRPSSTQEIPSTNIPLQIQQKRKSSIIKTLVLYSPMRLFHVREGRPKKLPVDGMDGRRGSAREAGAGVIVSD